MNPGTSRGWVGRSMMLVLSVLALCATGCATTGQEFDYTKIQSLEIGQTKDSDFRAMFGESGSDNKEAGDDGVWEIAKYTYGKGGLFEDVRARVLTLEFRNGVLNGYIHASSFDEDKTTCDDSKTSSIQHGVTTKEQVLELLGKPSGKVLSPTHMEKMEKANKPGVAEVWVWVAFNPISTLGDLSLSTSTVGITFDKQGIVKEMDVNVQHVGSTQPSTQPANNSTPQPSATPGA